LIGRSDPGPSHRRRRQGGAPFDPANCACLCRLHHEDVEHQRIVLADLNSVFP
jgi:hypothetical protein